MYRLNALKEVILFWLHDFNDFGNKQNDDNDDDEEMRLCLIRL